VKFLITLLGSALVAAPAAAQTDYRNLEAGRPTAVEDAYPVERYGFELSGGYRHAELPAGARHLIETELVYGFARGAHAAVRLPVAISSGPGNGPGGLAGVGLSVLVNLSTERTSLPGLAVRVDGSLPAGAAGGRGAGLFLTGLATRSFGARRLHFNALVALETPDSPGEAETVPRWWLGLALDQTVIRRSLLLVAQGSVSSERIGMPPGYSIGGGIRRQLTPTLVVDLGLGWDFRRRTRSGTTLTLGLSHSFAVASLMPGGSR
jgi:hypothetical protein